MKSTRKSGFTLVEIMIVVAIISLLAAIAIPNLLRSRLNANEATAINAVKTLVSAAVSYRAVNPSYPSNLGQLANSIPSYIDAGLGSGSKSGYSFAFPAATDLVFTVTARPLVYQQVGIRSFFADQSGVIRFTEADSAADAASPLLP